MKLKAARPLIVLGLLTVAAFFYFHTSPQAESDAGKTLTAQAAVHGFDYTCGDTPVSLRLYPYDRVEIQVGDNVMSAAQRPAASGTLYTTSLRGDGGLTLHTKGDTAILTRDGTDTPCQLVTSEAGKAVTEDQTAEQAAVETETVPLLGTDWQLDTLDGKPLAAGTAATMRFEEGRVGGRGGCNSYGGSYSLNGVALTFGDIMSTQMACDVAAMELELRLHDLLRKVDGYAIDDSGVLSLKTGDAVVMTLRPAKVAAPAGE